MKQKKHWYEYLWIVSAVYILLGFFNILFAWIGLLCFFIPLLIAIFGGDKLYCHRYCGRGQLFALLGGKLKLSSGRDVPHFLRQKWFRYAFLAFFMTMFALMVFNTYLVGQGVADLKEFVSVFWAFRLPWHWAYYGNAFAPWVAQFAFGFYSVMLTSSLLGLIFMLLFKPRAWCVFCPMGTMTQGICYLKHHKETPPEA